MVRLQTKSRGVKCKIHRRPTHNIYMWQRNTWTESIIQWHTPITHLMQFGPLCTCPYRVLVHSRCFTHSISLDDANHCWLNTDWKALDSQCSLIATVISDSLVAIEFSSEVCVGARVRRCCRRATIYWNEWAPKRRGETHSCPP